MQSATKRACGFFASACSMTAPISPPLPPIKTWVGAGSSFRISGALPSMISILDRQNLARFLYSSSSASFLYSTDQTVPSGQVLAASTLTEPVPAPMSQTTAWPVNPSLHRESARISADVIGAFPRRKLLSAIPGSRGVFFASLCSIYRT